MYELEWSTYPKYDHLLKTIAFLNLMMLSLIYDDYVVIETQLGSIGTICTNNPFLNPRSIVDLYGDQLTRPRQ